MSKVQKKENFRIIFYKKNWEQKNFFLQKSHTNECRSHISVKYEQYESTHKAQRICQKVYHLKLTISVNITLLCFCKIKVLCLALFLYVCMYVCVKPWA